MLKKRQPASGLAIMSNVVAGLLLAATGLWASPPVENSPALRIEIPEARIAATTERFLNIDSTDVKVVLIHILSPEADGIDYGQIFPKVNGAAAARITETRPGVDGKVLRLNLHTRPGFELLPGNNTIEVQASNNGHAVSGTFNVHTPAGPCMGGGRAKILELTSLGDLLHAGVIMDRLVQLVVACGVNFLPSALTDQKLQDLGADARLLAAIHTPTAPEFRIYQSKALTLDQVVDLLQSHVAEPSIIANVEDNGVEFPVNPGVEEKLRAAGASQKLIQSISYMAGTKVAATDQQALSVSQILHLLEGSELSTDRLFTLVQQRGVSFRLDRATEDRLRQGGANEKLIHAIRDASDRFSTTH